MSAPRDWSAPGPFGRFVHYEFGRDEIHMWRDTLDRTAVATFIRFENNGSIVSASGQVTWAEICEAELQVEMSQ